MAKKTVTVRMTSSERVRYDQIKEMTLKEWNELKKQNQDSACGWIDRSDVDEGDDGDLAENFEAVVVDKKGKLVSPRDEYTGG